MQVLTKKHPIEKHRGRDKILHFRMGGHSYAIPQKIAEQYRIPSIENDDNENSISAIDVFKDLNERYTKAGALLKGLRAREKLNQIEFAKLIHVTQANLSKMENGKRPIGKTIAKRLEQVFNVNYKYFLE